MVNTPILIPTYQIIIPIMNYYMSMNVTHLLQEITIYDTTCNSMNNPIQVSYQINHDPIPIKYPNDIYNIVVPIESNLINISSYCCPSLILS